jgi:hypothetical protein
VADFGISLLLSAPIYTLTQIQLAQVYVDTQGGNVSIALGDEAGELGQLLALIGELGHQLMSQVAQL